MTDMNVSDMRTPTQIRRGDVPYYHVTKSVNGGMYHDVLTTRVWERAEGLAEEIDDAGDKAHIVITARRKA